MDKVAIFSIRESSYFTDLGTDHIMAITKLRFDLVLKRVWKFVATAREEFNSIIGSRVMACRDNDTEVGTYVCGQVGGCGSGNNAGIKDIYSGSSQPRRNGSGNEVGRNSWIVSDYSSRSLAVFSGSFGKNNGGGLRQLERELSRNFTARCSANSIGAKKPGHGEVLCLALRELGGLASLL